MAQEKAIYTPAEIRDLLGLSLSEAYNLMYAEDFPSFRINRRWKVAKTDFWKWLDEQKEKGLRSR